MAGEALGLIEVKGLVAAIDAADAAIKTADVQILGFEQTKDSGLMVLKLSGEVAAVQTAIEAATEAASKITFIHAVRVIAKPHEDLISQV